MKARNLEIMVALSLLALTACGESASRQAVEATAEIGADGGTISLGAISVEVPAGTLGAETTLSVQLAADHPDGNIGPAYEIDAGRAALLAPVTIAYKVDTADLPKGTALADVHLAFAADGTWQALPDCNVDAPAGVVRCETTHFSIWGAVPQLPPIPCSTSADCPEMECMVADCDEGGCAYAADPACPCTPDCAGKECGDDGCGGSCGECDLLADYEVCGENGQCVCAYLECGETCCADKESCLVPNGEGEPSEAQCVACDPECTLGEEGCSNPATRWECISGPGGCPIMAEWECGPDATCEEGECAGCGDCAGKECGSDGCGGSCGECKQYYTCQDGLCKPEPGGPFWPCENNYECNSGWCIETDEGNLCTMPCIEDCPGDWTCEPVSAGPDLVYICLPPTCEPDCGGKECGDDGCGGSCGECGPGLSCVAGACVAGQACSVWDYITPGGLDAVGQCYIDLFSASQPLFPALYGQGHLFKEDLDLDGEFFLAETSADQTAVTLTAPCMIGLEIVVWSDVAPGGLEEGWPYALTDPSCLSYGSCDCETCIFAQASLEGKPTLDATAGTVMFGCDPKNCDCGVMSYSLRLADLTFADIAGEKQFVNVHSDGPDWLPMDEWIQTVTAE